MRSTLANLPLVFEPNRGQADPQVSFLARGGGYTLFLTRREAVVALSGSAPIRIRPSCAQEPQAIDGLEPTGGISNYFIGNDPARWTTKVPNYRKVQYTGVCPGVDVTYYGNPQKLEYDFTLSAWTDPGTIQVEYEGAESVRLAANGDLIVKTASGELVQHKPRAYQVIGGRQVRVEAGYRVKGNRVEFALARFNRRQPLVIDPVLVYSTYLGGTGGDSGRAIAVDSLGNVYVTGFTHSIDFPTASPEQPVNAGGLHDAFVAKISANGGTKLYATYLGGASDDLGFGIAVDSGENAYVTGRTGSSDFPLLHPMQPTLNFIDVFVTKLNVNGALLYSTYLGGAGTEDDPAIAVDNTGNAYIAGSTFSADFPTTAGAFQRVNKAIPAGAVSNAFVTKLNTNLVGPASLVYSTYLGGSVGDGALAIAIDSSAIGCTVAGAACACVTGSANSSDFPTTPGSFRTVKPSGAGLQSAFVTKLNAGGTGLVFSTFLGGTGNDLGAGIAVDATGNTYVTGSVNSLNFPTTNPIQVANGGGTDAFVTKLNPAGTALVYSTYLGGVGTDVGNGIAVDSGGTAYVVGTTGSSNFPVFPTLNPLFAAGSIFVSAVNPAGAGFAYSTYLSGGALDQGLGIAAGFGNAYVTGQTLSSSFPIVNAIQPVLGGGNNGPGNAFVTRIGPAQGATRFDFNGDGHSDVIWQDPVSGLAQVWFLGGAQGTTLTGAANLTGGNTWHIVGVGDFNADGHPDVVWQDPVTGAAQVWFLGGAQGNTLTGAVALSAGNPWRIVGVDDFNGDGHPDLIWQDPATGLAQIWFMGGAQGTTLTAAVNLTASNPWRIVGTGDFNGDGHPDVVWQDPVSGTVQVWYLGGAQGNVVTNAVNLTGSNPWRIAAVADFNGDGHPDVVWQDPASGTSQAWFLGGIEGTTLTGTSSLNGANPWRIAGPR